MQRREGLGSRHRGASVRAAGPARATNTRRRGWAVRVRGVRCGVPAEAAVAVVAWLCGHVSLVGRRALEHAHGALAANLVPATPRRPRTNTSVACVVRHEGASSAHTPDPALQTHCRPLPAPAPAPEPLCLGWNCMGRFVKHIACHTAYCSTQNRMHSRPPDGLCLSSATRQQRTARSHASIPQLCRCPRGSTCLGGVFANTPSRPRRSVDHTLSFRTRATPGGHSGPPRIRTERAVFKTVTCHCVGILTLG